MDALLNKLVDFEPFLSYMRTFHKCSPHTLKAYRADLVDLERFLIVWQLPSIHAMTPKMVGAYVEQMSGQVNRRTGQVGLASSTIGRKLATASSYMEYLRGSSDEDFRNPFRIFPYRRKRIRNPNPVEEYTLDLLLASMTPRDSVLFRVLAASGLRVSELVSLNRDSIRVETDVDDEGEEFAFGVGEVIGKGDKKRSFRVDYETAMACAMYEESRKDMRPELFTTMRGTRMSIRAVQERLQTWCSRLGFTHINVHRLRHTFATMMANNGMKGPVLQKVLGHESLATTGLYYKIFEDTLSRSYHAAMQRARGR